MNSVVFSLYLLLSFGSTIDSVPSLYHIKNAEPATSRNAINKTKILQLVNAVRAKGCKCGDTYYYPAPEVSWNEQLEQAAFNHSMDMDKKKYFAHVAPDGSNGGVRIERAGYRWRAYGENIAAGYINEKEVVEGWIKSPSHCKNIMNKSYREMGVARVGTLWTQAFGRK